MVDVAFTSSSIRITPSANVSDGHDEKASLRTVKVVPDNITSAWTYTDHAYGDVCRTFFVLTLFDDAHKWRRTGFLQFVNRVQFVNISEKNEDCVDCQGGLDVRRRGEKMSDLPIEWRVAVITYLL